MYARRSVLNFSVVREVIKTTSTLFIMLTSVLTSLRHTTASRQLIVYCPVSAPNGTKMCAVSSPLFGPQPQTFDDVKLSRCAVSTLTSNSAVFNYNRTDGHCAVFQSFPWFYEHVDGCVAYEVTDLQLFHRRTRASYVYNGCLAWYNVVLTPRVHSSVKFVGLPLATRATVE